MSRDKKGMVLSGALKNHGRKRVRRTQIGKDVTASLRFIEALGLWFHRVWAEWLAALSGGVYVPFEIYELAKGVTVLKVATMVINLIIVAYMSRVLFVRYRRV